MLPQGDDIQCCKDAFYSNTLSRNPHGVEKPANLTYHELIYSKFEKLAVHPYTASVLDWRQRIFHHSFNLAWLRSEHHMSRKLTIFNIKAHIYLMQNDPQIICLGVRNHHKLQRSRRLVIMKLVMSRPIGYEAGSTIDSN